MKNLLLAILMITGIQAIAQKTYKISTDEKTGFLVFKGPITFGDLLNEPSFKWFKESLADYKPDNHDMRFLADNLPKYRIVVFMGTWCDDSHYLVPKFYHLLEQTNFPIVKVALYGVDRNKEALGDEKARYKIDKVPTIILYRDEEEAGRITETVSKSIEYDLSEIVKQDIRKKNQ